MAVVVALASHVVIGVLFWRCVREVRLNREHLSLLEQDTDGQLEVLDRIDRIIHSRAQAMLFDGDLEDNLPPGVEDDRAEPRDSSSPSPQAG